MFESWKKKKGFNTEDTENAEGTEKKVMKEQ